MDVVETRPPFRFAGVGNNVVDSSGRTISLYPEAIPVISRLVDKGISIAFIESKEIKRIRKIEQELGIKFYQIK